MSLKGFTALASQVHIAQLARFILILLNLLIIVDTNALPVKLFNILFYKVYLPELAYRRAVAALVSCTLS